MGFSPVRADAARELLTSLVGLRISSTWRGHGSAAFLELGELRAEEGRRHARGQASVMFEWEWRVEHGSTIAFGSSSAEDVLESGLSALVGATVTQVSLEGSVPELLVRCSDDRRVRSFACVDGQPRWTVFLPGGGRLFAEDGEVMREQPQDESLERSA